MHRLQAKYEVIHKALTQEGSQLPTSPKLSMPTTTNAFGNKPRRRRIGRTPLIGQPKLFGGSLEEYLEVTNEEIPLIMKSCVRVINLYGDLIFCILIDARLVDVSLDMESKGYLTQRFTLINILACFCFA